MAVSPQVYETQLNALSKSGQVGGKTLVERLILKAKDLTVVVVDAKAQARVEDQSSTQAAA